MQGQACEGFTVGVVAALTFIITKAAGTAPADLAGLPDQSLWQAECKAHAKRPDLVHSLPDIPLSRGEFHAIRWGLEKKIDSLPTGRDIFEITNTTHPEHGNLMSKTLQIIAYAKRTTDSRERHPGDFRCPLHTHGSVTSASTLSLCWARAQCPTLQHLSRRLLFASVVGIRLGFPDTQDHDARLPALDSQ